MDSKADVKELKARLRYFYQVAIVASDALRVITDDEDDDEDANPLDIAGQALAEIERLAIAEAQRPREV